MEEKLMLFQYEYLSMNSTNLSIYSWYWFILFFQIDHELGFVNSIDLL